MFIKLTTLFSRRPVTINANSIRYCRIDDPDDECDCTLYLDGGESVTVAESMDEIDELLNAKGVVKSV
jgi:hypothetical protein